MRISLLCLLVTTSAWSACGGNDGPVDATPTVDVDNGVCGADLRFTGEIIDWDADAGFCGVFDAHVAVRDGGPTANTAPNGRYDVCVPRAPQVTLADVTPAAANSECTNPPEGIRCPR